MIARCFIILGYGSSRHALVVPSCKIGSAANTLFNLAHLVTGRHLTRACPSFCSDGPCAKPQLPAACSSCGANPAASSMCSSMLCRCYSAFL